MEEIYYQKDDEVDAFRGASSDSLGDTKNSSADATCLFQVKLFITVPMSCESCSLSKAVVLRSKEKKKLCKECFFRSFEDDIHETIVSTEMFRRGERVAVGMSGGKDSTVLAHVLKVLNKRHGYGLDLVLLCIDEGIRGYRDHSLRFAKENQHELGFEMMVLSFEELFGASMDSVVEKTGGKGNCSNCGTFRRRSLEVGARRLGASCIATGHNADDMAETVLLNLFRGDSNRLKRCTFERTLDTSIARCKPFKFAFQKEIVMYAFHKKLKYFSTECTYSPGAFRGNMRLYIKNLERTDPFFIINLIRSGDDFREDLEASKPAKKCPQCDLPTLSQDLVCQTCSLVNKFSSLSCFASISCVLPFYMLNAYGLDGLLRAI